MIFGISRGCGLHSPPPLRIMIDVLLCSPQRVRSVFDMKLGIGVCNACNVS